MSLLSGSSPRRKRGGSRASRELASAVSGPWTRGVMRAEGAPNLYTGELLTDARNMFCPAPHLRGAWLTRPNVARVGSIQLGSGSTRQGQCVFNHTRPDGTNDPLLFAGGKMYVWNGNIASPSVTDITPGAVTISTTARVFCVTFGEHLIVTDGVNRPWRYNAATATATYIDIDGSATAWTAFGPPVVYGGKLFFIVATIGATTYRSRIVWSEEADPSIGYQQTGGGTTYTNFWTLTQTTNDPLTGLAATNAALYYFRATSTGKIVGTVNAAFQTTATHDAVSQTIGTTAPATIVLVDEDIYFLDIQARQWRIKAGALDPLWKAIPESIFSVPDGVPTNVSFSAVMPNERIVLSPIVNHAAENDSYKKAWSADHGTYNGLWSVPFARMWAAGALRSSTGQQFMFMLGSSDLAGALDVEGYVYRYRGAGEGETQFDANLWDAVSVSVGLLRYVTFVVGDDFPRDQIFTRVTAEVYNPGASVQYSLQVTTNVTDPTVTATNPSNGTGYEADRVTFGINKLGRRVAMTLFCNDIATPVFRVARVTVQRADAGYSLDDP